MSHSFVKQKSIHLNFPLDTHALSDFAVMDVGDKPIRVRRVIVIWWRRRRLKHKRIVVVVIIIICCRLGRRVGSCVPVPSCHHKRKRSVFTLPRALTDAHAAPQITCAPAITLVISIAGAASATAGCGQLRACARHGHTRCATWCIHAERTCTRARTYRHTRACTHAHTHMHTRTHTHTHTQDVQGSACLPRAR